MLSADPCTSRCTFVAQTYRLLFRLQDVIVYVEFDVNWPGDQVSEPVSSEGDSSSVGKVVSPLIKRL